MPLRQYPLPKDGRREILSKRPLKGSDDLPQGGGTPRDPSHPFPCPAEMRTGRWSGFHQIGPGTGCGRGVCPLPVPPGEDVTPRRFMREHGSMVPGHWRGVPARRGGEPPWSDPAVINDSGILRTDSSGFTTGWPRERHRGPSALQGFLFRKEKEGRGEGFSPVRPRSGTSSSNRPRPRRRQ